jgi:internalin A
MKHLVPSLAVLFAAGIIDQSAAQSPSFKDPNLDTTIHKFLPPGKEKGPLTAEDLAAGLVMVSADGVQIHDLAGLEACKKLTFLYLPDAPVTDLTPISALTTLEAVTVRGGKIQDLTPLAGLSNLQYLDLSGNQISDLRPLAGLNLRDLNLTNNKISDLTPLRALPALEQLHLEGNQVSDLGPLAGLNSLWLLDIKGNRVADLSPLAGLKGWHYLYLDQNRISDLAPLVTAMQAVSPAALAQVPFRTLSLSGNPLSAQASSRSYRSCKSACSIW